MNKVGVVLWASVCAFALSAAEQSDLRKSLVFYSSFDAGVDAEIGGGDKKLHWSPRMAIPAVESRTGLPPGDLVVRDETGGIHGGCLRFTKKAAAMVFYPATGNMPYSRTNWNGTVSFWLSLTPDEDLAPGYTDPIQITSKGWDNAAFFVEFSKDEKPREFRLGVYADKNVWNPTGRDWNSIPMAEKPLLAVINPPFKRDQWTHVAFTFANFNTGKTNGVARLYLNGESRGALAPREQTFTWDMDKGMIMLGLSFVGRFDELAIFNRPLSADEVARIHQSKSLLPAK